MITLSSRCPDPEVIAAFVSGSLSGTELSMTAEHLRTCEDCRAVAAEVALIDREGVPPAVEPRPAPHVRWWTALAAAAFAGLLVLTYQILTQKRTGSEVIQQLVAAAPANERYIEPRLTGGFAWAPLHTLRGSAPAMDAGRMKLIGAAGTVLQEMQNDQSPDARHAAAVAHLLAGDAKQADDVLSHATQARANARMWSDLAATRYTVAIETNDHGHLTQALAAADAALRIDSKLPEALFNRALIIEHLGLRDQARAAWERYLAIDTTSQWAREARQHLQSLMPLAEFRDELQRNYAALQKNSAAARELARKYPQDARVWGETEILARWAESITLGDPAAAAAHLHVARAFADTTSRLGDSMLKQAVDAIERADDHQRQGLANAHIQFRAAQRTFKAGQPVAAEALFAEARRDFEAGNSPVALLATYFGANTIYEQGRVAESRSILEELATTARPEHLAHKAQVDWQLGLARASMGRWGDAINALKDSIAAFERLEESGYANKVREILAEVYDRLGERRVAWRHRIAALYAIGRTDPRRLRVSLYAAARSSAVNRDWAVTVSLLGLELELRADGDELLYAETLIDRARIETRLGERSAAAADLRDAAVVIRDLRDGSARTRAEVDYHAVVASLEPDPAKAIPAISRAIDFHRTRGRSMYLPELLLERGRRFAATGNDREAAEDFERGIQEVENQHKSVGAAEPGWGMFAVGDELFEDAIAVAVRRGDAGKAFAYSERSRAQQERPSAEPAGPPPSAARGTIVVEYATLPDRVVIFIVGRDRVRFVERNVSRLELTSQVELAMRMAMAHDDKGFRRASSRLYENLLEPVAADVESASTLVFVPDATLSLVPFGALLARDGRYVIEEHAVVTVPSHAWYGRLASRHVSGRERELRLLLMEGPESNEGEKLWFSRREAGAVAAQYGSASVIQGSESLDFQQRAVDADIIHFVGHAIVPDGIVDAALVTSNKTGEPDRLLAGDIIAMPLGHTRAVVLAACGTAQDRQRPGETDISIARAFLVAGVPSVIATLWPIDDGSAADFFPRLHAHLARGQPPSEALRATQMEWIHRPGASPGMWAAVQIIGI